ncbi:hypothetical protein BD626DRAFT_487973 [Schizophyllum amplum]|uniref:Uncharacterized protein n=1 Tax=Schizophyllum amplum TaxID=97359 RepID=A0A550CKA4_9AGAR|nr:hypothetical protein BD626DRAFT_487973 [Auriculariopsis ampla]
MSQSRASSTTPGEQSPPPAMQQSHSRARRGRSRTPRSVSAGDSEYDDAPRRRRRGGGRQQGGGGGALGGGEGGPLGGLPGIGEAGETVNGLTKGATDTVGGLGKNTLGGLTGGGGEQKEEGGGGDDTLKLRLDLNLDVWVELKAKVHGDVTLSLLQ